MFRPILIAIAFAMAFPAFALAQAQLLRSYLPATRTIHVDEWGTVFVALTNSGDVDFTQCVIGRSPSWFGSDPNIDVQEIDSSGAIIPGTRYQPFTLDRGQTRHFLLGLRAPASNFDEGETVHQYGGYATAICSAPGVAVTPVVNSVSELNFSVHSDRRPPDVIPVIVSPSADGVVRINPQTGRGVAAIAAINAGTAADFTFSMDVIADMQALACLTDSIGTCLAPRAETVSFRMETGQSVLISILVTDGPATRTAFLPATARLWANFDEVREGGSGTRNRTSIALTDLGQDQPLDSVVGQWRFGSDYGNNILNLQEDGRYITFSPFHVAGQQAGFHAESMGRYTVSATADAFLVTATPDAEFPSYTAFTATIRRSDGLLIRDTGVLQRGFQIDANLPTSLAREYIGIPEGGSISAPLDQNYPRVTVTANGQISGSFIDSLSDYADRGRTCAITGSIGGPVTLNGCAIAGAGHSASLHFIEDSADSQSALSLYLVLDNGTVRREFGLHAPSLR